MRRSVLLLIAAVLCAVDAFSPRKICLMPKDRLFNILRGKYIIKRQLGKGAFGLVHKVTDRETKETVALKMFMKNSSTRCFLTVGQLGSSMIFKESELPQLIWERSTDFQKHYFVPIYEEISERSYNPAVMTMELLPQHQYKPLPFSEEEIQQGLVQPYLLLQALDSMRVLLHPQSPLVHRDFHLGNVQYRVTDWQFKLYDFSIADFCDERYCTGRDFKRVGIWLLQMALLGGSMTRSVAQLGMPELLSDFKATPRDASGRGMPPVYRIDPAQRHTTPPVEGEPDRFATEIPFADLVWRFTTPPTELRRVQLESQKVRDDALLRLQEVNPAIIDHMKVAALTDDKHVIRHVHELASKHLIASSLSYNVEALEGKELRAEEASYKMVQQLESWLELLVTGRRDLLHSFVLFRQTVHEIAAGDFDIDFYISQLSAAERRALSVNYKTPVPWPRIDPTTGKITPIGAYSPAVKDEEDAALRGEFLTYTFRRLVNLQPQAALVDQGFAATDTVPAVFARPSDEELHYIWNVLRIAREVDTLSASRRSNGYCADKEVSPVTCENPPEWLMRLANVLGCYSQPPDPSTDGHIRSAVDEELDLPVGVLNCKPSTSLAYVMQYPLMHQNEIQGLPAMPEKPVTIFGAHVAGNEEKEQKLASFTVQQRRIARNNKANLNSPFDLASIKKSLQEAPIPMTVSYTWPLTANPTETQTETRTKTFISPSEVDSFAWEIVHDALASQFEAEAWLGEIKVFPLQPQEGVGSEPFTEDEIARWDEEELELDACLGETEQPVPPAEAGDGTAGAIINGGTTSSRKKTTSAFMSTAQVLMQREEDGSQAGDETRWRRRMVRSRRAKRRAKCAALKTGSPVTPTVDRAGMPVDLPPVDIPNLPPGVVDFRRRAELVHRRLGALLECLPYSQVVRKINPYLLKFTRKAERLAALSLDPEDEEENAVRKEVLDVMEGMNIKYVEVDASNITREDCAWLWESVPGEQRYKVDKDASKSVLIAHLDPQLHNRTTWETFDPLELAEDTVAHFKVFQPHAHDEMIRSRQESAAQMREITRDDAGLTDTASVRHCEPVQFANITDLVSQLGSFVESHFEVMDRLTSPEELQSVMEVELAGHGRMEASAASTDRKVLAADIKELASMYMTEEAKEAEERDAQTGTTGAQVQKNIQKGIEKARVQEAREKAEAKEATKAAEGGEPAGEGEKKRRRKKKKKKSTTTTPTPTAAEKEEGAVPAGRDEL